MRNLFTALTLGFAMLFMACEAGGDESTLKHLEITSETTLLVEAEGGSVAITYTIKEPIEGKSVETNILNGDEMINAITSRATGVILVDINKNSAAQRIAIIEVRYGTESTNVTIQQKGSGNNGGNGNNGSNSEADVEFVASCLDGYYYGEKYGEGSDRYAFFLSDQGLNNGGQAYTNGTYYYIDCFAPANKSLSLPLGTYTFDKSNTGNPFTINSLY